MEFPIERRYAISTYSPEGTRARLGRYMLKITGQHVEAVNRTGGAVAVLDVVETERNGNSWVLRAEDGSWWEMGGCSCGG